MNRDFKEHRTTARSTLIVAIPLLLLTLVLQLTYLPYAEDDAYIHMRIARHFMQLGSPFFNGGDNTMASTAPLWVVATAPFALLGTHQPLGIAVLNGLITVATSLVWALLFRTTAGVDGKNTPLLVLAVWATLLPSSLALMETPLAMLLTGLALLSVIGRRHSWIALAVAACLVRPECTLYLLVACAIAINRRSFSLRAFLFGILVAAPILSGELYYFGSIFPHTAVVKAIVYQISPAEFVRLALYAGFGSWVTGHVIPLALLLSIACMLAGLWLSRRPLEDSALSRSTWRLITIGALAILSLYALRLVVIFPWYAPLVLVPLHVSLVGAVSNSTGWWRGAACAGLAPLVAMCVLYLAGAWKPPLAPCFESGARARTLLEVGTQLAQQLPNRVVLAPEIGALGYAYPGYVLDPIGLATPDALAFHPLAVPSQRPAGFIGAAPAAFIASRSPDLIVGLSIFLDEFAAAPISSEYQHDRYGPLLFDDYQLSPSGRVFGTSELSVYTQHRTPPPNFSTPILTLPKGR